MKQIHKQAKQLVKEMQMIADSLADYNPGPCRNKISLNVIQRDVGSLARELAGFHGKIGEKIKNANN